MIKVKPRSARCKRNHDMVGENIKWIHRKGKYYAACKECLKLSPRKPVTTEQKERYKVKSRLRMREVREEKRLLRESTIWTRPTKKRWVDYDAPGGCWRWLGKITHDGYGQMAYGHGTVGREWVAAHIWMYVFHKGFWDRMDMELDHLCHNRWCVNPDHLEPVTRAENIRRRDKDSPYWKRYLREIRGEA